MLGALGAMAPDRKSDLAQVVLRAMIAGNVACFMTACIAGRCYGRLNIAARCLVINLELESLTL